MAAPHIVFLPSAGMASHVVAMSSLAKKLTLHHDFSATMLIPSIDPELASQQSVIATLPEQIKAVRLSQVDAKDLPSDAGIERRMFLSISKSISFIRDAFESLMLEKVKVVAFVVDFFGTDAVEVAAEFGVPVYVLCGGSAVDVLRLLRTVQLNLKSMEAPAILDAGRGIKRADGLILTGFYEMEPETFQSLENGEFGSPPPYAVGPLLHNEARDQSESDDPTGCLKWLDEQPDESVLYVSFGSFGTLSQEQITELALGLEMSGCRFLWVVRKPNDITSETEEDDPLDFLPNGFIERTKGVGFVVSNWAPQPRILSHGSLGGLMVTCGWNTVLEAIVHGLPMIAWPLYGNHALIASFLVEEQKSALRVRVGPNGVAGRDEIVRLVKVLMHGDEGAKIKTRITELQNAADQAVGPDGSSTKSLAKLTSKWMKRLTSKSMK